VDAPRALRVRCPAKINLGLWILGRRKDGYHEIDTILQTVMLEDELVLEMRPRGFSFESRGLPIPGTGPNLVERAWHLLEERAGSRARGIHARLTKRIPVGGGLGGGSSDAAGLLVGANRLLDLGLEKSELQDFAVRLGADVCFFIDGGTARATGRGDQVRHLCPPPPIWVVLAMPPVAISTTWAYGRVRNSLTAPGGGANMLAAALATGGWDVIAPRLHNDFEDVVLPEVPIVAELRRAFESSGALGSLLSGSGSTIFGLATTRDEARRVAERVGTFGARIQVVRCTERGVTVAELV